MTTSSETAARMLAQARASIAMTRGDADAIAEQLAARRATLSRVSVETGPPVPSRLLGGGDSETTSEREESPIPMEMDLTSGNAAGVGTHRSHDDISVDLPDEETDLSTKITQYAKMILPHVGLVILLAAFTLFGAVVFNLLELPHEEKVRESDKAKIFAIRKRFVNRLWNISQDGRIDNLGPDLLLQESQRDFDELFEAVFEAFKHQFITAEDLKNQSITNLTWTLPNSIFFSTTVITTIGYGNLVPATMYGRAFCIGFALMGIPLLLVTIADIGKFLSDFLSFLYRNYRNFKRKLRRQSRRLSRNIRSRSRSHSASRSNSPEKAGGLTPDDIGHPDDDTDSDVSSEDALRIPVVMVMLVLLSYTALGGFLFRYLEEWPYFEAFYFCFITMATVGFGDFVPTQQVYMFFTMAYIIFGLALATMCIDLAGTEYIRKIHYIGQKMDSAKEVVGGAVVSGFHASEGFLKNTGYGFIKTAGGKLVAVRGRMINSKTFYLDAADFEKNILYEPLSANVAKVVKPHIGVLPEQIHDTDAYIVNNKVYNQKPMTKRYRYYRSPNAIHRQVVSKRPAPEGILVAPFVLKESNL